MRGSSSLLPLLLGTACSVILELLYQPVSTSFVAPAVQAEVTNAALYPPLADARSADGQTSRSTRSLLSSLVLVSMVGITCRSLIASRGIRRNYRHARSFQVFQKTRLVAPVQNTSQLILAPCAATADRGHQSASVFKEKKSVEDLLDEELTGKKVLLRCDLNVPLSAGLEITDDTRITSCLPTIRYLCEKGAKVIACSHLGRPKSGPEQKFSLKPVARRLGELMRKDIQCAPDCRATDEVRAVVDKMADGDVVVLENTRFHKGETKNDPELAESMASLADLFVNDAFGTAHRAHSSTEGVTKFLQPCVAGFLLKKELDYLKSAVDAPERPMAAIVGGAKVSTKIPVIESMLDKVDKLIIGGGMVFTFLKARGLSVGDSLVEDEFLELAVKLEADAVKKGVELILPSDIACGDAFPSDGSEVGLTVVSADGIPDGWTGLDNGPKATQAIKAALADCKTIIWNGPMGVFESKQFCKGTYDIAEWLAELTEKNDAITIIGGGDSVSAVNKSGLAHKMSHISTGGGASLELLEGKVLPGVAALDDQNTV